MKTKTKILFCGVLLATSAMGGEGSYRSKITRMAQESKCSKYIWKNRGVAPAGFSKGLALSFARSYCRLEKESALGFFMSQKNTENDQKDALAHYEDKFDAVTSYEIDEDGSGPLKALYTLGFGLGMRQSSGRYCAGSGGSQIPEKSGAGLFKSKYALLQESPHLRKIYSEYLENSQKCYRNVFAEQVTCRPDSVQNHNETSLSEAKFNKFLTTCPAFATEFAMASLRVARTSYGPINRKEAELNVTCHVLLDRVESLISQSPVQACKEIL